MTKLLLATALTIASLAAAGSAFAGYDSGYDPSQFERFGPTGGHIIVSGPWGCRDCGFSNGTHLSGIAIEDAAIIGIVLPEPVEIGSANDPRIRHLNSPCAYPPGACSE